MNTTDKIDISKLDKAEVLRALFNNSKQQGFGLLHTEGAKPMSIETARSVVTQTTSFDYLMGRVMKVDIGGDEFSPFLYDRDNGRGAAARAIASIQVNA